MLVNLLIPFLGIVNQTELVFMAIDNLPMSKIALTLVSNKQEKN